MAGRARVRHLRPGLVPQYIAAVETPCGSHTHTLAPDQSQRNLYVYVSSYSPNPTFPDCQPPHDAISIVKVPRSAPEGAFPSLAGTPALFPDGGNPGGNGSSTTSGCHDITAYPSKDIAAGACMGDGILFDIADRQHPVVTEQVRDTTNFAFWVRRPSTTAAPRSSSPTSSAAVAQPRATEHRRHRGANGIYDIVDGQLEFASYYKMPRTQSNTENCVAHNGSLIPIQGRDVMVQAWYQGGISVYDFTDPRTPASWPGSTVARCLTSSCSSAAHGRRTGTTATSTPTTSRRASTC